MSIQQKEEELFKRWSVSRSGFVKDGVVNEDEYLKSIPKVLFILKEVNDYQGDVRDVLRKGNRAQTWSNVTRWMKGIRHLKDDIPWRDLEKIEDSQRREELKSIAVMNLKKTSGKSTTNEKELERIVAEDIDIIRQQIELYNADFTICCGSITARLIQEVMGLTDKFDWTSTKRGIIFHRNDHGKSIVHYFHPEARCSDNLLYYGLVDAIREILA